MAVLDSTPRSTMAGLTAVPQEMGHGISAFSQMVRQVDPGETTGNADRCVRSQMANDRCKSLQGVSICSRGQRW